MQEEQTFYPVTTEYFTACLPLLENISASRQAISTKNFQMPNVWYLTERVIS